MDAEHAVFNTFVEHAVIGNRVVYKRHLVVNFDGAPANKLAADDVFIILFFIFKFGETTFTVEKTHAATKKNFFYDLRINKMPLIFSKTKQGILKLPVDQSLTQSQTLPLPLNQSLTLPLPLNQSLDQSHKLNQSLTQTHKLNQSHKLTTLKKQQCKKCG
jgi:hypothetical protein